MNLSVQTVFDATLVLAQIIRDRRPTPQKGAYRIARMHAKLNAEFATIATQRDALITAYDHKEEGADQFSVPPDKMDEFLEAWKKLADEKIEVDVQPIPLSQLDLGTEVAGPITASELITLGDLVSED